MVSCMSSLRITTFKEEYVFAIPFSYSAFICTIEAIAHADHQSIYAIDRSDLNKRLLDTLDSLPNVKLLFNHKLTGADFRTRKAWFEVRDQKNPANGRPREIEIDFDLMIGADGAHSAVRYHLMKFTRMDYQQEYIDTLWCEFNLGPRQVATASQNPSDKFLISPNHLHIWPGKEFMFIAIPSEVSITSSLFETFC